MLIRKFFILLSIFFTTSIHAQFTKGQRMAGATIGSIFYNSGKADYTYPAPTTGFTSNVSNFSVDLRPSMGWFVSDNTAIGASFIFGYSHQKVLDEDATTGNTFNKNESDKFSLGIGGFARNYFKSSGNLHPFGQFSLNFGIGSSSTEGFFFSSGNKSTFDGKSSGDFFANAGLSLGVTKMLNKHTGLDFYAGYSYSYNKNTFKTTTLIDIGNNGSVDQTNISEPTQKFTNHGLAIGVGFQIFLDAKK